VRARLHISRPPLELFLWSRGAIWLAALFAFAWFEPKPPPLQAHWDDPALHYRLLDGDTELLPGLNLIETSGHAPGHQSVLVRLPRTGPVLLAIDAVSRASQFTPDRTAAPIDDNEEQLRASTRRLLDLAEREGVTLVIFGHDGEQWQTLKKAPDYYG